MALTLESGLKELPGIGDARAARLAKLGLATVENLLGYYPRSYEDRTKISTIDGAPEEQPVCVAAFVAETPRVSHIRKGLELVKVKVADETAVMTVTSAPASRALSAPMRRCSPWRETASAV